MEIFITLLSGAFIGTIITGLFNIYSKHKEYKHSYLKMVLEKRILAYENLNTIISELKISTITKSEAYHIIFNNKDDFNKFYSILIKTQKYELWLSNEVRDCFLKLFQELTRCLVLSEQDNLVEIGKKEYTFIGKLRDQLESNLINDFKTLYNIDSFLNKKIVITSYEQRDLRDKPKI